MYRNLAMGKGNHVANLSLISTIIIATFGLSACGGGGGGGSTSTPTPTPVDNPPTVTSEQRMLVSAGDAVSLTASATDPDGDAISYSWEQQNGEPVANPSGFDAATASFNAPDDVGSYTFEVTASANGKTDNASVFVIVVEDVDTAIFIDAEFNGNSDGSIDAPYTEFSSILEQNIDDNADVDFYIKTPSDDSVFTLWENSSRTISQDISFYGGYSADWHRDAANDPTPVTTDNAYGIRYSNTSGHVEVSGLALTLTLDDISNSTNVEGIAGYSSVQLMVRDNVISLADYPFDNASASLFGVVSDNVATFSLLRNEIHTGSAPVSAIDQVRNNTGNGINGENGENGNSRSGGEGGDTASLASYGGDGGDGGNGFAEDGDNGQDARTSTFNSYGYHGEGGDASNSIDGENGKQGRNGSTGAAGTGGTGFGRFTNGGRFGTSYGSSGGRGTSGTGGGGGGGGASSTLGFNGGGGGGGGEGAGGGVGGFAAQSGGASVGVYVIGGTSNEIDSNTIITGNGGIGGIGGLGANGGSGGVGGSGASGNSQNSGDGGNGGKGGDGGDGGIGGSGGGGPSFGVMVNPDTTATVTNNHIETGSGGNGGSALIAIENAAGKGGWSVGIFDADLDDASVLTLEGNTFVIGEPGNDGNPSAGTGTAAQTNQ